MRFIVIRLLFLWLLISSVVSILLIDEMLKVLPSGGAATNKYLVISTELNLLKELIALESLNKAVLQEQYNEIHRGFKASVIQTQVTGIGSAIYFYLYLALNVFNFIIVVVIWVVGSKRKTSVLEN